MATTPMAMRAYSEGLAREGASIIVVWLADFVQVG